MRKKIFSVLLCAAMVVSALTGCGNTTADASTKETEESVASVATEVVSETAEKEKYPLVDEPITFKGVVINARTDENSTSRVLWDRISELTGVNFEWVCIDNETVGTFLAAGDWDFDFIHSTLDNSYVNDYGVEGGMFADYNDYLEYMPNLQQVFVEFPEARSAITETNGAIYRLPNVEVSATSTQVRGYYNTALAEEVGYKEINTVDDFYNVLVAVKEKNGGEPGWSPLRLRENGYIGLALYCAFGDLVTANFDSDAEGNVIYNRTSDQYRHYLEFMNKLYEEKLIDQEYLTRDSAYVLAQAQAGKTVFWDQEAHSLNAEDFADGQIHIGALKAMTSEYDSTQTYPAQLTARVKGMFLNAECENLDILCQILDMAYAKEEVAEGTGINGQSFTYGIEGEHYVLNEDKTYDLLTPADYAGTNSEYQYKQLLWENTGLAVQLDGYITSTPGNNQARQMAFRDSVFPYVVERAEMFPESYLKFTSDEQTDMTGKLADITAYVDEMKGKFITGVADIDTEWDAYVKGLYDRHLQEVIDIYQAAYDRYNQ